MPRSIGTGRQARELTAEEIRRLDRCLSGTTHEARNRALFFLGLYTGMRIGELVGLSVGDVYRRGRFLKEIVIDKHTAKSKKTRSVPLSASAQKPLKDYFAIRNSKNTLKENEPLFPSQQRPWEAMPANTAIKIFDKMARVAKVENVSTHSLRRTCATPNSRLRRGAGKQRLTVFAETVWISKSSKRFWVIRPWRSPKRISR